MYRFIILTFLSLLSASALDFHPPKFPLPPEQQAVLDETLKEYDKRYNSEHHLIRKKVGGYNYHSNLRHTEAHEVRRSAEYAVALLDSGSKANHARALLVLDAVIKLQNLDPSSREHGIWPYYLEEPVPEMGSPDRNWADFIGVQLLQARLDHGDRLPADLRARLDTAIQTASSAIRKRNVGPGYTNISIMGAFVNLATGQLYEDADLTAFAKKRWTRFYDHTMELGGFNEYNSPTYTIVALDELVRILQYIKFPEARRQAIEIYELAWKIIATHHHPPSGQWAGPHSRTYRSLLRSGTGALLDKMGGRPARAHSPHLESHRLQHQCPEDYRHFFRKITEPRLIVDTFASGKHPIIGTTWITKDFTLGTANRADFWNQRRPLIAYWGSLRNPSYLQPRFLREGYDFAAAQVFVRQDKNRAIAAINFATNGGNKHVSIDRLKDGTFKTTDFRLRFELGGGARKAQITPPKTPGAPATITHGGRTIQLAVPFAKIGSLTGTWEVGGNDALVWLDLVFHQGDEIEINLTQLKQAALAFALTIDGEQAPEKATATIKESDLHLSWNNLSLQIPHTPATLKELQQAAK